MRALFWALIVVQISLVWWLPVLVGHDVPQHMAMAKILSEANTPHVARLYEVSSGDLYASTHFAIAWLARVLSLDAAMRVVYSAYALAVPLGFARLLRAVHRAPRERPELGLLGVLLVWNPIVIMGLVPFMLAFPIFVWATAFALSFARTGRARDLAWLLATTALLAIVHVVALGFFLALLGLLALRLNRRALAALASSVVVSGAILALKPSDSARGSLTDGVGAAWSSWGEKGNVILATIFGPFPHALRHAVMIACVLCAIVIALRPSPRQGRDPHRAAFTRAALAFGAIAIFLTPSSIRAPDDLSLIDFRLFVYAFAIALAAIPPRWFRDRVARGALALGVVVVMSAWTRQLWGAALEAKEIVSLIEGLGPDDRVLALCFHDRSDYFDESNGILHYLGVHHTARTAGVTSLFWGKFAKHLPVGYRPGMEPPRPPDWSPHKFNELEVQSATHVLVTWPDADEDAAYSGDALESITDRVHALDLEAVACRGRSCLFAVPPRERRASR